MTDNHLEHTITFAMIAVLAAWFLFNTAPAFGMTPDEVNIAKKLLEKESELRNQLRDAKTPDAEIAIQIYTPSNKEDSCHGYYGTESVYTGDNGKAYCLASMLTYQKVQPSIIGTLQNQLDEVEKELSKLGVREAKKMGSPRGFSEDIIKVHQKYMATQGAIQNGNRQSSTQIHGSSALGAGIANPGTITAYSSAYNTQQAALISAGYSPATAAAITRGVIGSNSCQLSKPIKNTGVEVGEKIGYRMWHIKGDYLLSYYVDRIWAPDEAMSGLPTDHGNDGIWAFKEKSRAINKMLETFSNNQSYATAFGSIKMWGKVIEYELGYRAEFAKIVSIDDVYGNTGTIDILRKKYKLEN